MSRRDRVLSVAILSAGLLVRLLLPGLLGVNPYGGDGAVYAQYAANMQEHGIYSEDPQPPLHSSTRRMPGVPVQIWLLQRFVAPDSWLLLLPNVLMGWGCMLMVFVLLRGLRIRTPLLHVVMAIYATVPVLDYYARQLYPEVPAAFLTLLSWYFLFRFLHSPSPRPLFLAGLFLGLSLYFRPEMVLHLAPLGIAVLLVKVTTRRRWLLGTLALASTLLVLSPWILRNLVNQGRLIPLVHAPDDCRRGLNSWVNSWSSSERHFKTFGWQFLDARREEFPAHAFDTPEERTAVLGIHGDAFYTCQEDRVLADIARQRNRRRPFRGYVLLPLARVWNLTFRTERSDTFRPQGAPQRLVAAAWLAYAGLANLVMLLALILPLVFRRLPPILLLIFMALVLRLLAFAYLHHVESRYMVSLFPLAFICAAYFVDRSLGFWSSQARRRIIEG